MYKTEMGQKEKCPAKKHVLAQPLIQKLPLRFPSAFHPLVQSLGWSELQQQQPDAE